MDAAPPPAWHSAVWIDPSVVPRGRSEIPGFEHSVEQCGEFAYRYFRSQGKGYPTLGQPWVFLTTGRDEKGRARPSFLRFFNNGPVPPRAGDILVAKGWGAGQFHTAIVTRVDGRGVGVLQANVSVNWRQGRQVTATYPLVIRGDRFGVPALPFSQAGFGHDYPVVGWIRPTGRDALPAR